MKSMTGFGIARGKVGSSDILIEARSVNHRFCEVSPRFPGRFASLEPEVTRRVRQRFARGKFDLFLREEIIERDREEIALARKSHHVLKKIQKELGLKGEASLSDVLNFREILFFHTSHDEVEKMYPALMRLVETALTGLERMREREGSRLQKWFEGRAKRLLTLLAAIEGNALKAGKSYRQRLEKRMKNSGNIDKQRLIQESAMMAERADVMEEIVRLRSHMKEFGRFIREKESVGRKIDFLAQEMGREINTIGSKSQGVRIAHQVVEFKSELERIKEQIQNVE